DALGTKQYKPEDTQELFRKVSNDVQNIHEELAEHINTPGWNRPAFYDDDDHDDDVDYTIAITPVLSTEEPIDSLSMGDEHLDTIPATGSDEVIKSSVENLDFSESNNEVSSIDDDSFSIDNIDFVEASPPDSELVSSEVMEIVILEVGGIDDDVLLKIKDDILRKTLLNANLLIATIEALNDNLTPSSNCKTKSSSTSPKSFLEETNTFHNSLPEFESFYFDLEEISSGSTTTQRMPPKRSSTSEASTMSQADIRKLQKEGTIKNSSAVNLSPIGIEQANRITWTELKRLLTNKYYPRTEIKKMEDEFYKLSVKGNDLKTYVRRFQELIVLCPNMVPNNEKLMEVFIDRLPKSIEGNVTASKPQTLEEAINIAQRLMDQVTKHNSRQGTNNHKR
nr:reverse transcriptase domain-containing protein [Tanacetum cinerariifolium]